MDDPAHITLKVADPIVDGGRRFEPNDVIAFCRSGKAYVIREIPNTPGRWLLHLEAGSATPRSHDSDETVSELLRLSSPGPPAVPPARRLRRRVRAG